MEEKEYEYVLEVGLIPGFLFGFRNYYYEDLVYYSLYIGPICISLNKY